MNNYIQIKLADFRRRLSEKGIDFTDDAIDFLEQKYNEPHRYYHGWNHIEVCLHFFDEVIHLIDDPTSVLAAIFYHDIIYDLERSDNEEKSAELAYDVFASNGEFTIRVKELVEDTDYGKEAELFDNDAQLLKDIDFSSFAQPFEKFWNDIMALNKEEGDQDPQTRLDFYSRILEGEFTLFRTDYFKNKYWDRARQNIENAIQRLKKD